MAQDRAGTGATGGFVHLRVRSAYSLLEGAIKADAVGKIDVFPTRSYVAIARAQADVALARLRSGRIKGRKFRVNRL